MPDNNKENRFMAMLERRGIVRKSDPEEKTPDKENNEFRNAWLRPESGEDAPKPDSTPAGGFGFSREEKSFDDPLEGADTSFAADTPPSQETQNTADSAVYDYPSQDDFVSVPFEQQDDFAPEPPESEPPPGPSADTFVDVNELYATLSLKPRGADTIYLVEDYLNSLPDSLPEESRRDIVTKIIDASGFEYDRLIGDGVLRVRLLKEYAEQFSNRTDDYISEKKQELDELERRIIAGRKLIEERRELHKRQFYAIETEAQRLKAILGFISG